MPCRVSRWVPPLRGVSIFLASPRKSKQKEGDPGSVSPSGIPCATRFERGLRNSGLRPSNSPRPLSAQTCVARHLPRGPEKRRLRTGRARPWHFSGLTAVDLANSFSWAEPSLRDAFRVPMRGAEQRRKRRKEGEDCLRPAGPSSAAPAGFE